MATNWNAVLANVNNSADILSILRKVLSLLDGKVDLTKIDEIIEDLSTMKIDVGTALRDVNSALGDFDNSSQEAIQQVIEAGLMEGFATEAELLASRPTVSKKYAKAEDTDIVWFWNKPAGSPDGNYWISTGLSELDRAKSYANEISSEKVAEIAIVSNSDKFLHGYKDKRGGIYAYYDLNGGHVVPGLEAPVQDEINTLKAKSNALTVVESDTDIIHFKDGAKNLISKYDEEAGLILTGLEHSVQYYLLNMGQINVPFTCPKSYKTKADLYALEVLAALDSNTVKAPIGRGLLAQQYHLGESWVNKLSMPASTNRIVIGAYNDGGQATQWVVDSGVVHPNVIKFDGPVCGFKYWMGINPYTATNENFELPYIYGFNNLDLSDLTLITDFPQPFDIDPPNTGEVVSGHLSDSFFTYDPINAELWFCWRQTLYGDAGRDPTKAKQTFFGRKTKDGTNWSDRLVVYPQYTLNNDKRYSPSIMFNHKDGLFYLYYITFSGALGYETSESITNPNWKKIGEIQLPFIGWHLEMKWCGDMLVALVENDVKDELYLGITRDMKTFSWSPNLFNEPVKIYKSSFIPIFNDNNQIAFRIFYTTDANTNPQWQLHVTHTNFVNIED